MPLSDSVPQVPVRLPGEEEDSWVDIEEELNHNRILFLCEELKAELANDIIGLMLFLDMEDKTQSLYFFINSPGGEVISGMAIDNVMQLIRSPVMTICLGIAASMASYILAGGTYKKRVALPHARIMIHQIYAKLIKDKAKDKDKDKDKKEKKLKSIDVIYAEFAELLTLRETIARGYSERTGKPLWIISQDLERQTFMSAREAQAYGIVDRVVI